MKATQILTKQKLTFLVQIEAFLFYSSFNPGKKT